MPLYDFHCSDGHKFERFVKLTDFEAPQHCSCHALASRVISAPMFRVENVAYDCPVTGDWIGSKSQHEENLRKHSSRVLEPGERQLVTKNKEAADAAFDKSIEDSVEREFESLSSDKKERLANEVLAGADISIERKAV